ncbi:MAG: hypothetical protein RLY72_1410, partial [Planctomycetota bacterium]
LNDTELCIILHFCIFLLHRLLSGNSEGREYTLNLVLLKEIDVAGSKYNVFPMNVSMKLTKKNQDEEFWPRLLLDKNLEKTNVKIDWDKYVDEDEEKEGFDTKGYGDVGGIGGKNTII